MNSKKNFNNSAQIEYRKKLGRAREKFGEMLFCIPTELIQELLLVVIYVQYSKISEKEKSYYEQRFIELTPKMEESMVEQWGGIEYSLRCSKYLDLIFYLLDHEEEAETFYFDHFLDKLLYDLLAKYSP